MISRNDEQSSIFQWTIPWFDQINELIPLLPPRLIGYIASNEESVLLGTFFATGLLLVGFFDIFSLLWVEK